MTYTFPVPPGINHYWRRGRNGVIYKTQEAKDYHWHVRAAVGLDRELLTGPVAVSITVYRKRRSGDLDGFIKLVLDAMQGVLYENDSQVVELHAYRRDDKSNPRLEVEVKSV